MKGAKADYPLNDHDYTAKLHERLLRFVLAHVQSLGSDCSNLYGTIGYLQSGMYSDTSHMHSIHRHAVDELF